MSRQGNDNYQERKAEAEARALAVIEPPRMLMQNLPASLIAEHGLTEVRWRALIDAVFPSAKTIGGVALALDYCKARSLDPFKRPVHVVPMWNSKLGREVETVWPGIGELRTTASRTGVHAGNDDIVFGRMMRQAFRDGRRTEGRNKEPRDTSASCPEMDFPEWAQMTVYKIVGGQRVPFVGPKVFFIETFSGEKGLRVPNARWRQAPRQMLEKCAEAAALRRAFPEEMSGLMTAEEMEGKVVNDDIPQAQYSDVDNGGGVATTTDQSNADGGAQQDQKQDKQPDDGDGDGWAVATQESYLQWLGKGFATVKSEKALQAALAEEEERLTHLSPDRLEKVRAMEKEALERIAAARKRKPAEDRQQAGGGEQTGDAPRDQQQDQQKADGDQGEPPYVRNMRRTIADAEFIADLNNIEAAERVTIDELPAKHARVIEQLIADKRAVLKAA